MIDDINESIRSYWQKPWRLSSIDCFLNSFFFNHLPASSQLQTVFGIDTHSSMIVSFLKNRTTQFERVHQLIGNCGRIFLVSDRIQRILLSTGQYHALIDGLVEDNKCVTLKKLLNNETRLVSSLETKTKNIKLPGFSIKVLQSSYRHLTGKHQHHITKIILQAYITVRLSALSEVNKVLKIVVFIRIKQ